MQPNFEYKIMTHSQLVCANDENFKVTFRGKAWQQCEKIDSINGTIEMTACSVKRPELKFVGLIHGYLSRAFPNSPFSVEISLSQSIEILESALSEWAEEEGFKSLDICHPTSYRIKDARWYMKDCAIPHTQVPRYAGSTMDALEDELKLGSRKWMQDWPLEVADHNRIQEFCAFYDRITDISLKFDTMQLALFSYDDYVRYLLFSDGNRDRLDETISEWFEQTLRRDFYLHGNTIADWAMLELESEDPELNLTDPEFIFAISGQLRRIWETSLIPIDLQWDAH